jgi:hypothetical protein
VGEGNRSDTRQADTVADHGRGAGAEQCVGWGADGTGERRRPAK